MTRRRTAVDSTIDAVLRARAWVKRPRWNPQLRAIALAGAVLVATIWTRSLIRGVVAVAIMLVLYGSYRAVSWFLDRRRRTIEAGLPVLVRRMVTDFVRERSKFSEAEKRWDTVCAAQPSLRWAGQSPNLHRMQLTLAGDVRALVSPGKIGGDVESIAKLAVSVLPGAMSCREVTVVPGSKPGSAWITFLESDPLGRVLPVTELPSADPDKIAFGVQQDGEVAQVLMGISMLIGGLTRSGKSSTVWAMLAGLNQRKIPVELWLSDGKGGMELQMFEQYVGRRVGNIEVAGYTTTAEGTVAMMEQFAAGMFERQAVTRQAGRKVTTPTEDHPLRIFLMDELLAVKSTLKTTAGKTSATELVINQGAATLDMIVALTQAAKVSQIGDLRDAFALRLCMKVKTLENQKAILGDSTNLSCVKITDRERGVGVYVTDDGQEMKFRSGYSDDAAIAIIAGGGVPKGMRPYVAPGAATGAPCYVYRAYDKQDRLMYVGKTNNRQGPRARFEQHRKHARKWCAEHQRVENWWRVHVDESRLVVQRCDSPEHMDAVEQWAIINELPRFNDLHNDDNPLANMRLDGRAGVRRRVRDAAHEWAELVRDERAIRQVQSDFKHRDRVAAALRQRDEFEERVLAGQWSA